MLLDPRVFRVCPWFQNQVSFFDKAVAVVSAPFLPFRISLNHGKEVFDSSNTLAERIVHFALALLNVLPILNYVVCYLDYQWTMLSFVETDRYRKRHIVEIYENDNERTICGAIKTTDFYSATKKKFSNLCFSFWIRRGVLLPKDSIRKKDAWSLIMNSSIEGTGFRWSCWSKLTGADSTEQLMNQFQITSFELQKFVKKIGSPFFNRLSCKDWANQVLDFVFQAELAPPEAENPPPPLTDFRAPWFVHCFESFAPFADYLKTDANQVPNSSGDGQGFGFKEEEAARQVLGFGIDEVLTYRDIKQRFNEMALKMHPDKIHMPTPEDRTAYQKVFNAYKSLSRLYRS